MINAGTPDRLEVDAVDREKERKDTQKALIYDIRLLVDASEKETYTKQELLSLLDQIARTKDQE
ncbi:hypothetical protein D7X33_08535 [Butyricicoccus sp. 1XD8-22]|nr:hypothetical protein D7X33_08535 [Butyricicoccus sp. 1XD8-22]